MSSNLTRRRSSRHILKICSIFSLSSILNIIADSKTRAVVKTPSHTVIHSREAGSSGYDCVRYSPHIRSMREVIDNNDDKCMVFEYRESDLCQLRGGQKGTPNQHFLKNVARSVLGALTAFVDVNGQGTAVHTG